MDDLNKYLQYVKDHKVPIPRRKIGWWSWLYYRFCTKKENRRRYPELVEFIEQQKRKSNKT